MWIEEELKKDAAQIQRSIQSLSADYYSKIGRSIRTCMRENKENTTRFFMKFYDSIRTSEYDIYKELNEDSKSSSSSSSSDASILTYTFNEIRNSANDLPHPRILSELQHNYDKKGMSLNSHHKPNDDEDRYIPYKIYCYIREKSQYCIRFQRIIRGRLFTLYFITFPESHISVCTSTSTSYLCAAEIAVYQHYAYKVYIWLSIVSRMSDIECSEKLDIYFYMTPFKKQRPLLSGSAGTGSRDDILSAIHVNTGLTRNCERHGEIVVYRTEEWFKVFIHESLHNFNIDFIDLDLRDANERLRRSFCIPHGDILLFEAYTETWARIINTMIDIYVSGSKNDRSHFTRVVRENLIHNSFFHLYQLVKALDIMDLKYSQISVLTPENIAVCRKRYAEETNVYAYYIFGGILSAYALSFVSWCCDHNTSSVIRFKQTDKNLSYFTDLICNASRDPVLLSVIEYIEMSMLESSRMVHPVLKKTMRMTLE